MDFSIKLINWYNQNKRDLPWRNTCDPYKIWLSEIILQQTRVNQGLPYYEAFVSNFPTVFELSQADEQAVLKLWQGLGYYSRARNLHATAQQVVKECNGVFPVSYDKLLQLKGIGPYTAAAIASFASNEAVAVVDGNVFRVLARVFGIDLDISKNTTKTYFQNLAHSLMNPELASIFNQAIMEFGALQCVPKNPQCNVCVFQVSCEAVKQKRVQELPVKTKIIKTKNRFFNYVLVEDVIGNIVLSQRKEKDIWQQLYELELYETGNEVDEDYIIDKIKERYEGVSILEFIHYDHLKVQHKLSHQNLWVQFFRVRLNMKIPQAVGKEELKKFPFPIVLHNFMEKIV